MDNSNLLTRQGKTTVTVPQQEKKQAISFIQEQFNIKKTIVHLHVMMEKVTEKEFTADSVNAACNCIARLNEVMNTTINAAKFLGGK